MTFTHSATTAKAAHIKKRRIGSISVSLAGEGFDRGISRANRKKLARLKKITLTIRAWVTLATRQNLKAQQKTRTIYQAGRRAAAQQQRHGDAEGI